MRQIILSITIVLLLTACDPGTDCYIYVRNNCSYPISVITTKEYADNRPVKTTITNILSNENKLIHKDLILDTPPKFNFIQLYFFSIITITNGDETSKRDFMNSSLWELTTNKKGLNYEAFFYLTVNPEDFE